MAKISKEGTVVNSNIKNIKNNKIKSVKTKVVHRVKNAPKNISGRAKNKISNTYKKSKLHSGVSSVKNGSKVLKNKVSNIRKNGIKNIPSSIKNNVKNTAKNKAANLKNNFKKLDPTLRARRAVANNGGGIKGTAVAGLKGTGNLAKNSRVGNAIRNTGDWIRRKLRAVKNVGKFIVKFKIPIGIITTIISMILFVYPFLTSLAGAYGSTPHYYCKLYDKEDDTGEGVKNSSVYKQYCYNEDESCRKFLSGSDENGIPNVPVFIQQNGQYMPDSESYENTEFPSTALSTGAPISSNGCGYCSTAAALSIATGELVLPSDIADYPEYASGGMLWSMPPDLAARYGVSARSTADMSEVVSALESGNVVVLCSQSGNPLHGLSHITLLTGMLSDGTIAVMDPNIGGAFSTPNYYFTKEGASQDRVAASLSNAIIFEISGSKESSGNCPLDTGGNDDIVKSAKSTPSPGVNLCAAWVTHVYQNAGVENVPYGNANDMWKRMPYTSKDDLKPGMCVAVEHSPCGSMGYTYGHIGIYIGEGMVMDNVGSIVTRPLEEWESAFADPTGGPVHYGYP